MTKHYWISLLALIVMTQFSFGQQVGHVQRGQRGYVPPSNQPLGTYIELKDPQEELNIIVPKCEKELGLDAFQVEIFKSLLTKKIEEENGILTDKANSREDRKKKLIDRNTYFITELETIFSVEQIEKYKIMDFTVTKEDKKKNRRKNKKKN